MSAPQLLTLAQLAASITGKPCGSDADAVAVLRRQLRHHIPHADARVKVRPVHVLTDFDLRIRYAPSVRTFHVAGWAPSRGASSGGGTAYRPMLTAPVELILHLVQLGGRAGSLRGAPVEIPARLAEQLCPAIVEVAGSATTWRTRRGYLRRVAMVGDGVRELVLTQPSGDDEAIVLEELTLARWKSAVERMKLLAAVPPIHPGIIRPVRGRAAGATA